ncbi:glycosyltransferase family 2 protein [Microbacterium sp. P02]|uniref:glycosyltransferase family 2 protein n=1 Tax=Microbacterium sp. P02 TaxID=3366260 RepID=UPI0036716FBB
MTARVAVITVASQSRAAHLQRQQEFLDRLDRTDPLIRVVGWLDEEAPASPTGGAEAIAVHVSPGVQGLRVAAGRNAAARAAIDAGAEVLVFLDADCLAGPELLGRYERAAAQHPDSLLCGPVTYLAEGVRPSTFADMLELTRPHPARPMPDDGELRRADPREYDLFWSLSFALTSATWQAIGEFSPVFEGYGAEDTDFAWRSRERGVALRWVGGAHAYHQWHPTSSPPWQHLDDILRNGATFAGIWGRWPMSGWLDSFAAAGAIRWNGATWVRTS